MGKPNMSEAEMEAFKNTMNGMTVEEQEVAVQFIDTDILWDELRRRETAERNRCQAMQAVMLDA